jgi:ribosomal protein L37AE/L43A
MSNRRDSYLSGLRRRVPAGETIQPPERCPFCESKAVGTLAKVITESTYWRCQACGEMWNPQRLERTSLPPRRGSSW